MVKNIINKIITTIRYRFNRKKWKNQLKKTHNSALQHKNEIKHRIENMITSMDPVELLSHVSLVSQFGPEGETRINQELRDTPVLHFLIGLCLKNKKFGNRQPSNQEVGKIIELLKQYFIYFSQELMFQSAKKEKVPESDGLILSARLQKTISQINSSKYRFQLEDMLQNIFSKFNDYFFEKLGFSVNEALIFGQKIIERYERLFNKRCNEARAARKKANRDLKDPVKGPKLQELFKKRDVTVKEAMDSYSTFLIFAFPQEIFIIKAENFCKEEEIQEIEKFKKYLKALSCRFGDGNKDYNSPLDENLIITKPLINIDNKYFSPIPQDLIYNLPLIFESFLEKEKENHTKIWQNYQKQKSQYTEDRIYNYFSRLFPEQNIHRNLKYTHFGKEYEVDSLILYDNKIFVIESKAGSFTEPAQRGAIKRLKTDLRKLIEEAYQQGRQVINYIKSSESVTFRNKTNKEVLEIKFKSEQAFFFLINVTLEPLMSLATGLKRLRSLGLFVENEYPWSVNLFELDLVTRHIPSPTIFIHYLEKRLLAQSENVFYALDELSFLAWYLERSNFYTPLTDNGKKFNLVSLDGSWVAKFDDHYLWGKEAPKLKIEADFLKIIRTLEILHPEGYSDLASGLLDFDHPARKKILTLMNKLSVKSKKDKKMHSFAVLNKEDLDMGFIFVVQAGRNGLKETLGSYCIMKKYQTKIKRWIGIGRDVLDDKWFVNAFLYLNFPWKKDPEIDKLLRQHPFLKGKPKALSEVLNNFQQ